VRRLVGVQAVRRLTHGPIRRSTSSAAERKRSTADPWPRSGTGNITGQAVRRGRSCRADTSTRPLPRPISYILQRVGGCIYTAPPKWGITGRIIAPPRLGAAGICYRATLVYVRAGRGLRTCLLPCICSCCAVVKIPQTSFISAGAPAGAVGRISADRHSPHIFPRLTSRLRRPITEGQQILSLAFG
jgi:hypothetical protein